MSNTEVALNSSVRQPSVSYQATVRTPNEGIQNRVSEPKVDWVNYALSEGGRALQGYANYQAGMAKISAEKDAAAKKQADEDALRNLKNQLARETLKIASAVHQGNINQVEGETKFRALRDQYIGLLDEKDVNDIMGRHDYGVQKLEQSRWTQWQTKDIDRQAKVASEYRASNPYAIYQSDAEVLSTIQRMNDSVDDLARIQQRKNLYPVGSEQYNNYQALEDAAAENNMYINVARHMSNLLMDEKNLTPEALQEITNRGLDWCVENGINYSEGKAIIDNTFRRMGVYDLKQNYLDTQKISLESAENAAKMITTDARLKALSIPEVAIIDAIGGKEAAGQLVTQKLLLNKDFDTAMTNLANRIANVAKTGTIDLPESYTGFMIQGTNSAYAKGTLTPYTRGTVALTTLKLINQNNGVSYKDGEGNTSIALSNYNGAAERLNLTAMRRDAKILQGSDNPDLSETGRQINEELDKLDANRIVAGIMTKGSPLYETWKGLVDSLNAGEIKYDENGNVFLSGTSGTLGEMSVAFRGVGGEGSYNTQMNRLNESLSDLTPEVRKSVMDGLGFSHAVRGERSILAQHGDQRPQVIDEGTGEELYISTQSDEIPLERGKEVSRWQDMKDAFNEFVDYMNGRGSRQEEPKEEAPTVSKASASATMTFENAYPSIQKTSENAEDYDAIKNAFEAKKKALGYRDYLYQRQAGFRDSTGSDLKEDWSEEIEEQEKIIKDSDDIIAKGLNKLQGKAPQEEDKSIDGLVNRYSKEFGVEAKQVLAILKRESAGDEKAVSKAGARGLMQLMPDTFEEVKRELKLPKDADIFDPEINIRAGTYYFSKMMKQFNGDVNKALAAYNWGPGNVRRAIRAYGDDWFEGARTKGIVVDGKRRYLPDETLKYVSALGKLYA